MVRHLRDRRERLTSLSADSYRVKNVSVLKGPIEAEPWDVDRWCRSHLGSGVADELLRYAHLSAVIGIRLNSGPHVVVKVRRPSDRLVAGARAHHALFERGFPCPEPLVDLMPFGEHVASAEEMTIGGDPFPDSGRSPEPFAQALAHLVALSPTPEQLSTLDPLPPWTFPPYGTDLWPWPDDRDIDLNAADGPAWIEESGRAARDRLHAPARHRSSDTGTGTRPTCAGRAAVCWLHSTGTASLPLPNRSSLVSLRRCIPPPMPEPREVLMKLRGFSMPICPLGAGVSVTKS